jgi:hypothetical protein
MIRFFPSKLYGEDGKQRLKIFLFFGCAPHFCWNAFWMRMMMFVGRTEEKMAFQVCLCAFDKVGQQCVF